MRQESVWIITGQVAWQSYPGRRPVCFIESIRREILAGQSEPVIGDSHNQHGRQVRERGDKAGDGNLRSRQMAEHRLDYLLQEECSQHS